MSAVAPERLITAEEFAALDLGEQSAELVRGEVVLVPKPKAIHGWVAMQIALHIGMYLREHKIGELFAAETGFLVQRDPDTVCAPDVAFVSAERLAGGIASTWLTSGPDLAVEVLSEHDRWHGVVSKVDMWLASGSQLVWVVDPIARRAWVFEDLAMARIVSEPQSLSGEPVLPGFRLRLSDVLPAATPESGSATPS